MVASQALQVARAWPSALDAHGVVFLWSQVELVEGARDKHKRQMARTHFLFLPDNLCLCGSAEPWRQFYFFEGPRPNF